MTRPDPDPDPNARLAGHLADAARRAAGADDLAQLRAALQERVPDYELGECIGRGGAGAVFRARQRNLDRSVAIKALLPPPGSVEGWAERFRREAQALARLQHPGIVTVHDYGQAGELAWLIMELVEGANLRALMADGRLTPAETLAIIPPICEALQYAHDRGIVHRDIKPENVLIDLDGRVKLVDFGLAKLTVGGGDGLHLTRTGQAMGTPRYMAPEQLERPLEVDHRADIFSLGVVLYEMLTGQVPAGVVEPPSRKVAIDVRLDDVVLRALQREPERRYQSAVELETGVQGVSAASSSPTATGRVDDAADGPVESGYSLAELIAMCVLPVSMMATALVTQGTTARSGSWEALLPFALIGVYWLGLPVVSFVHWLVGRRGERIPNVSMPLIRVGWAVAAAVLTSVAYHANVDHAAWLIDGSRGKAMLATLWYLQLPCALFAGLFGAWSSRGANRRLFDAAIESALFPVVVALAAVPVLVGAMATFSMSVDFSALAPVFSRALPFAVQLPIVVCVVLAFSLRRSGRRRGGLATLAFGLTVSTLAHAFCMLRYQDWSVPAYLSLGAALLLALVTLAGTASPVRRRA